MSRDVAYFIMIMSSIMSGVLMGYSIEKLYKTKLLIRSSVLLAYDVIFAVVSTVSDLGKWGMIFGDLICIWQSVVIIKDIVKSMKDKGKSGGTK